MPSFKESLIVEQLQGNYLKQSKIGLRCFDTVHVETITDIFKNIALSKIDITMIAIIKNL